MVIEAPLRDPIIEWPGDANPGRSELDGDTVDRCPDDPIVAPNLLVNLGQEVQRRKLVAAALRRLSLGKWDIGQRGIACRRWDRDGGNAIGAHAFTVRTRVPHGAKASAS